MFKDIDIKFVNKEITPFGGLSLFFKMLEKCGFEQELQACGLPEQGSNRGYKPWQLIYGLFAGVWCGACKFGHLDLVRYDRVLSKMVGWNIGAGHRSYQRYLDKFTQATNQRVFGHLYKWFFDNLVFDNYTLDFDSTVMVREGDQEGAAKGYNPKRPGRNSHHPLIAFVSDIRMIANYWLRPGNTSASTNYLSFLEDSLENLDGKKVGLMRMDSGFFSSEILDYLEMRSLNYIVACRFGLQFLLAVPARLDQLSEEEFPQDNPLRIDKHPAYFSKSKDKHVLYLARSLKTRSAFQGIWTVLDYSNLPYKV